MSKAGEMDYLLLDEMASTHSSGKNENKLKISEVEDQDITTLNKHCQSGRLFEIKQQIEIAESRCDTLKQQLNYMRNLYIAPHTDSFVEHKKDNSKKKGKGKNKSRKLNIEGSLEKKLSDPSILKVSNKLTQNLSNSIKSSPRIQTKKGEKMSGTLSDVVNYENLSSYGDDSENITHEFLNRDLSLQSRPVSANSRLLSVSPTSQDQCFRPSSTPNNIIDMSKEPSQVDEDKNEHLEPEHVIQNILCGITDTVNHISEMQGYIHDSGRECLTENSRVEDFLNKFYTNDFTRNRESEIREVKEDAAQTSDDPNNEFCSVSNIGHFYEPSVKTKKNKSRSTKRDIPPKLLTPYTAESIESIRKSKKKSKLYIKHVEKKSKGIGSLHLHLNKRTKIPEDISLSTKIRKKRTAKLRNSNSRNSSLCKSVNQDMEYVNNYGDIGDSLCPGVNVMHSDNVIELYHNSSHNPETSASDDAFTRLSHPSKSQEYHQKVTFAQREISNQEIYGKKQNKKKNDDYHISDDLGDVIPDKMQVGSSNERLERVLGTPHLGKHNSAIYTKDDDKGNAFSGEQDTPIKITNNFQLPTVSSKLKQVDRSYYQRFNFHNIPFVAGTSTTPSHNLGLNIQQVLSIIKLRQPVGNYIRGVLNSHLFGTKQNEVTDTLSRRFSHVSNRTVNPNFDLPEKLKSKDGVLSNYEGCPSTRPATALSVCHEDIDLKSTSVTENPWGERRNTKQDHCESFPNRNYVNYQKILNQYLESGEKLSFLKPRQELIAYKSESLRPHISATSRMPQGNYSVMSSHSLKENEMQFGKETDDNTIKQKNPDFFVSIEGRAKSLKDVLINLHDDFKRLNIKYEELQAGVSQDSVDEMETLKQLDALEAELQSKEEEITVVMALYKEVLSLKKQVKSLREKASMGNFQKQTSTGLKPRGFVPREPTSVQLTKLLRTIQNFQDKLKYN